MDAAAVQALTEAETERLVAERPRSAELNKQARSSMPRGVPMAWMDDLWDHPPVWVDRGEGSHLTDVDGHTYVDMFVADMSAFCGHAPRPVVEAVTKRMALGNQFLMPSDDALVLTEHLAARYGLPKWQFTLSATQANTEVIRLARALTGREIVLVFDGKYHGELDTTLVVSQDGQVLPEMAGLARSITAEARVIPWNDIDALEAALAPKDVALVLAEPAMTNVGFLLPADGYHDELRRLTRETGTLLGIDETHSLVCAYAGFTRDLGLDPDFLTLGKSIAAGVPLATYGMREEIAALITQGERPRDASGVVVDEVSTGGTLFANPLSMAAGRAALLDVLTEEAFARTAELGERVGNGLRDLFAEADVDWSVVQYGAHAFYFFSPEPPTDGAASRAVDEPALRNLIRVFLANRGVWESGWWLGPTVSVAHTAEDVDRYLEVFEELLAAVA